MLLIAVRVWPCYKLEPQLKMVASNLPVTVASAFPRGMRKNKPEVFRGQATMRVVVGVFLFLDFALACFLVVSLFES
jgi:hypothetical protein